MTRHYSGCSGPTLAIGQHLQQAPKKALLWEAFFYAVENLWLVVLFFIFFFKVRRQPSWKPTGLHDITESRIWHAGYKAA